MAAGSAAVSDAATTSNTTREVRRSFGWRTGAAVAGLLSTFLLTVVAVRTLPPAEAAVLLAILAALSIGPLLGRLGLGPNVIRLLPAETDPTRRRAVAAVHLRATALLSASTAPVVAVIATIGLLPPDGRYLPVVALTVVLIVVESVRLTLSDVFAALGRVRASVATTHHVRSALALPLVCLAVLLAERPTLTGILAVYFGVAAVQVAVALLAARADVALRGPGSVGGLRQVMGSGALLVTLDLAAFLVLPGTIWLASAVFEPRAAAQYSTAAALAQQVTVLESLAALAVMPAAARLWAAGRRAEVVRVLSAVATLGTLVTVVVVLLIAVLGGPALRLAYGPDLAGAHLLLVILAAGGIGKTAFGVNVSLLIVSGELRPAARTAGTVLAVAVPAGIVAALTVGPVGLAAVSAVATVASGLAQWRTARRVVPAPPRAHHDVKAAWRGLSARAAVTGA
jgi:O-antigen/teichoic acid export membrane protein